MEGNSITVLPPKGPTTKRAASGLVTTFTRASEEGQVLSRSVGCPPYYAALGLGGWFWQAYQVK